MDDLDNLPPLAKNELQEIYQQQGKALPTYKTEYVGGSQMHNPLWQCTVTLHDGKTFTTTKGYPKKKTAELAAAMMALKALRRRQPGEAASSFFSENAQVPADRAAAWKHEIDPEDEVPSTIYGRASSASRDQRPLRVAHATSRSPYSAASSRDPYASEPLESYGPESPLLDPYGPPLDETEHLPMHGRVNVPYAQSSGQRDIPAPSFDDYSWHGRAPSEASPKHRDRPVPPSLDIGAASRMQYPLEMKVVPRVAVLVDVENQPRAVASLQQRFPPHARCPFQMTVFAFVGYSQPHLRELHDRAVRDPRIRVMVAPTDKKNGADVALTMQLGALLSVRDGSDYFSHFVVISSDGFAQAVADCATGYRAQLRLYLCPRVDDAVERLMRVAELRQGQPRPIAR